MLLHVLVRPQEFVELGLCVEILEAKVIFFYELHQNAGVYVRALDCPYVIVKVGMVCFLLFKEC